MRGTIIKQLVQSYKILDNKCISLQQQINTLKKNVNQIKKHKPNSVSLSWPINEKNIKKCDVLYHT